MTLEFLDLLPDTSTTRLCSGGQFLAELSGFNEFGMPTRAASLSTGGRSVPVFINEFWTSKQRAASSLHEISYRACFKPQLPRFFIERLTQPGDLVYDPFMGRGTTLLEAALLGRRAAGSDINPLSKILVGPRLAPPSLSQIAEALGKVDWTWNGPVPEELLAFYHPETLREICALRAHLSAGESGQAHRADAWVRMTATNRLTGHSPGFFSVYTLPPNQAVSVKSQLKINERRNQVPPRRVVHDIILKKSKSLLSEIGARESQRLAKTGDPILITGEASQTPDLPSSSVSLVVTSPPFLDVVDYAGDNWLRCWFNGIDPQSVKILMSKKAEEWQERMHRVFVELSRVVKPKGHVAFEVGEVRNGKVKLEELVIPAAAQAGFEPFLVLINDQEFTKTSNCWGVDNGKKGTNTNRVVLLQKP
jgi:hypothetical protein